MLALKGIAKDIRAISSSLLFVRNTNFQSRNPPEPHFDRKRMLEICKPICLPDRSPDWENCPKSKTDVAEIPHPYEVILSKELKKSWDTSRMILFYHLNPLRERTQREIRNIFFKQNLHFYAYSSNVMKLAVSGTPFTSVLHLYESNTAVVFSEDISLVNKALKISRKVHQQGVALMGGIIDNVFYSKNQIEAIGELFKRDSHQELAQFLDYIPSKVKSTMNHHTQLLSHYLTQVSSEN